MAQRGSHQDEDQVAWATTGIRLGVAGLDLRQQSNPETLTRLVNARFVDDRTLQQREGHSGTLVRDQSDLAPLGDSYAVSDEWVYGHGARISGGAAAGYESAHHPFPRRGAATFNHDGTDVLFTGDRLLMVPEGDGASRGQSSFWQRSSSTTALDRGIPAYLPLMTDSTPPATVSGDYVETCLTPELRVYVYTTSTTLVAWLINRETGTVIHTSEISGASNAPVRPVVVNSAGTPVVIWRDSATNRLYSNSWTGTAWTGAVTVVSDDVQAFDVAVTVGGFYVAWRTIAPTAVYVGYGRYAGYTKQNSPCAFGTIPSFTDEQGALAIGVAPDGSVAIVSDTANGLTMRLMNEASGPLGVVLLNGSTGFGSGGLSVASRGLKNSSGYYPWVIHAASSGTTLIKSVEYVGGVVTAGSTVSRFNCQLASKSFRVGDEVFCWLRSALAGTHFLVGGSGQIQVCGYADREEAIVRTLDASSNYGIPHVLPDPLDEDNATFTWARSFNTGQTYARGGNVRVGDIDFLADPSIVRYGKSTYLSGSACRAWDGVSLGDAGWQDYPTIASATPSSEAVIIGLFGDYYYRVYAVRYNARGERFQSAAVSHGPVTVDAPNNAITLSISTIPSTNHDDVILEIYRTEASGSTFYLVGTVANTLAAASVAYVDSMADTDLLDGNIADSHAAGVGALSEIEEWGPLGCSILAVAGDRMWGAGGQVPSGNVQFSKLKEEGEGVGFDTLAGFQTVDPAGHPVTSIAAQNDFTVVFQAHQLQVIQGTGPDNYGRGSYSVPTITLADGAVTHAGTVLTQQGVLYWGDTGPRLLTNALQVIPIAHPIRQLAGTMTPSGVVSSLSRQEVVWYTRSGNGLLLNYQGERPRWAQWTGLQIAGCSATALATTDGRLLRESSTAEGDDGQAFEFGWTTGDLRPEQVIQGFGLLRSVGVAGAFLGTHRLRMRIYYNGSPRWTDEWVWEPESDTWLASGEDFEDMTPAEVDALRPVDRSGAYATHKRVTRQNCHFFRVAVSNIEATRPTYVPSELSLELGVRGGLGRVAVPTFNN